MTWFEAPSRSDITAWVRPNGLALGGGHEPLHPVAGPLAGLGQAGPHPTGIGRELVERVLDQRREVGPQPRVGLELVGVGDLVDGDERPERVALDAEGVGGGHDVGLHEVEPAAWRGSGDQQADVVLPQHLGREECEQPAELMVADAAIDDPGQRGPGAAGVGREPVSSSSRRPMSRWNVSRLRSIHCSRSTIAGGCMVIAVDTPISEATSGATRSAAAR